MAPEPFINVEAIAKHLGVPKSMIYVAVEEHGMPVARIGRHFRFRISQVEAWAAARGAKAAVPVTPPPARPRGRRRRARAA